MRDLWRELGDLRHLLRHPLDKNPPSLLRGDDYFLAKITEALTEVRGSGPNGATATGNPPSPVELILTGTLWDGRLSTFTDDMGTNITEQDHDATFRFVSDGRGHDQRRPRHRGRHRPARQGGPLHVFVPRCVRTPSDQCWRTR
jgi:hypothetical protein